MSGRGITAAEIGKANRRAEETGSCRIEEDVSGCTVHTECFGGDQVIAAIDQDVNRPGGHGARPAGCQHSIQTAVLDVSKMNSRILQGSIQQLISAPRIAGCNKTCQQDS
jgi:hypothetical protein